MFQVSGFYRSLKPYQPKNQVRSPLCNLPMFIQPREPCLSKGLSPTRKSDPLVRGYPFKGIHGGSSLV